MHTQETSMDKEIRTNKKRRLSRNGFAPNPPLSEILNCFRTGLVFKKIVFVQIRIQIRPIIVHLFYSKTVIPLLFYAIDLLNTNWL